MSRQVALAAMRDAVALWYCHETGAAEVVRAACDLLVVGVDGPAICMLAAIPYTRAEVEVPDALEPALIELGLPYFPEGSNGRHVESVKAMASRVLSGALSPRDLARWAHAHYAHHRLELAENLSMLDDVYDELPWVAETEDDVDALVRAEAQRIGGMDGDG